MAKSKIKVVTPPLKVGDVGKTVYEVNGQAIGTKAEVVAIENSGTIYRAKFVNGNKVGQVIRVITSELL